MAFTHLARLASWAVLLFVLLACGQRVDAPPPRPAGVPVADGALPSWNDGPARTAILDFVKAVSTNGSADFVAAPEAHRDLRQRRHADGDFETLEYVTSGPRRRLGMIVHHTDGGWEWACDAGWTKQESGVGC